MIGLLLLFAGYVVCVLAGRYDIPTTDGGGEYLQRWRIFRLKWWRLPRVFLHRTWRADPGRDVHNHPWPFAFTVCLWGGYVERIVYCKPGTSIVQGVQLNVVRRGKFSSRAFHADRYHQIIDVFPNTWTLFVTGPKRRDWGFLVGAEPPNYGSMIARTCTHVPWRTYLDYPPDFDLKD